LAEKFSESSFIKQIHFFGEDFSRLKGVQIGLKRFKENRGGFQNRKCDRGVNEIREKLYELKKGLVSYRIADFRRFDSGEHLVNEPIDRGI